MKKYYAAIEDSKQDNHIIDEAARASKHARSIIARGSTQLKNNKLQQDRFLAFVNATAVDLRSMILKQDDPFRLEPNPFVYAYERAITLSQKYSLGNCLELTLHALDYFVLKNAQLRVEAFRIEGGDHAFLVINREYGNDPNDPSTWGEKALICDPWSNKIYPASEYRELLKNFYTEKEDNIFVNKVEDFDSMKHKIVPLENFNTDYLQIERQPEVIRQSCYVRTEKLLKIVSNYIQQLSITGQRLSLKYGENNPKATLILHKLSDLEIIKKTLEIYS